jgi:uncharacterized lipoprotein YddW (UPF0748 family)
MTRSPRIAFWLALQVALGTLFAQDLASRLVGPIENNSGSPKAVWRTVGGARVLDLQCPFDKTAARRCFWDLPVKLDLRDAAALRLNFRCPDPRPIAQFSLYLRSNNVWHAANFSPQNPGQWEKIVITKSDTRPEGTSQGWGRVDRIRLAAWRGEGRGTSMQLADIQTVLGNPTVAILRGKSADSYAGRMANALADLGIVTNIIDQADATEAALRSYRVLFVPHLPKSDAKTEAALLGYIRGGGHPIVFYTVPDRILSALGFEPGPYYAASKLPGGLGGVVFQGKEVPGTPDRFIQHSGNIMGSTPRADQVVAWWADATGKLTTHPAILVSPKGAWMTHVYLGQDQRDGPRAMLALAGQFAPELWRTAALARLREAPQTIGAADMSAVMQGFAQAPAEAQGLLRQAVVAHNQAIRDLATRRYLGALDQADACRQHLVAAVLAQTRAPQGEFRGAWCHRGYGVRGWTWEQSAQRLSELGINALFVNVTSAASASYPSRFLAPTKACREQGDQLAACLAACRPRGVQVHGWMLGLSLGTEGAATRARVLASAGRLQTTASGATAPYLCPSHPANRALLRNTVQELVSRYPLDGIHFDFVRYAGENYCYCPTCRRAFEKSLGHKVRKWPEDAQKSYHRQWLSFRRATISSLAKELRDTAKRARPSITVSAAVFENWLTARETVGQDWQAWCRRGWLDLVCPMDYTAEPAAFRETVLRQQSLLRGAPVRLLPGIGLSSYRLEAMPLLRQIAVTRQLGTGGFLLFEFNESEAMQTLPQVVRALSGP